MKLIREFDDFECIRDTTPNFDENNTPRVGDVLVCLPGYYNSPSGPYHSEEEDPNCAGAGYAEGRIIVVEEVDVWPEGPEGKRIVVWPNEEESEMYWDYDDGEVCFECGIFGFALTYYTETLNESDDFDWANNRLINPWELGYDLVFFDEVPTRKDVEELIEMALTSLNLNRHSKKSWSKTDTRNNIIRKIINRANLSNRGVYLIYYENMGRLLWGSGPIKEEHNKINKINYSNLIETNLTESDVEWAWVKDVKPRLPLRVGTCLTFKHSKEEEEWEEDEYGNMIDHGKMNWHITSKFIDVYNDDKPTFSMVATDRMGESRQIFMEVEKVKELYEEGVYEPCKKQPYLKRIMKEESEDPLQWIRDIQPLTFKDAVIGQTYDITTRRLLLDAIRECNDDEEIYLSKRAEVIDKDNLPYGDIFCNFERRDEVPALFLKFFDKDGFWIGDFWVTEDMVQLH